MIKLVKFIFAIGGLYLYIYPLYMLITEKMLFELKSLIIWVVFWTMGIISMYMVRAIHEPYDNDKDKKNK